MSQCVPSWDLDENPTPAKLSLRSNDSNSTAPDVPTMLEYEVAELTWENGQLGMQMHSLGTPREKTRPTGSGTLESIVNQATCIPLRKLPLDTAAAAVAETPKAPMTRDALVPSRTDDPITRPASWMAGCSTHVGSCSGAAAAAATTEDEDVLLRGKRARVARVHEAPDWSRDHSVNGSDTFGGDSLHVTTLDTSDRELGMGFTSTSLGSPENTSSGQQCTKTATTTADDPDSVCHTSLQREAGEEYRKEGTRKSSISTKRSRAAAIHNQSERKRRDKINQKMKTLQKMVPNSSKTDKASMLDEVIEYMRQLEAQIQMANRMNMAPMMLPMTMQQQHQMSMMAPMGMGMGMGMGMHGVMDMNPISRPNMAGISSVFHPSAFMPITSWDGDRSQLPAPPPTVMPDPMSTFQARQSQPMTMDAYNKMVAMYQQLHQPPASSPKS